MGTGVTEWKLRIPKKTKILRVTCPNPRCGTTFLYPKQKIHTKNFHDYIKIKDHPIFLGLIITLCF